MQELTERLNAMCDELPFQTGWYLKDLKNQQDANHLGATIVPSASTRKIAILMTAMKWINDGKLSLEQPILIDESNQYVENASGCLQYFRPGFTVQLYDVLTMMIIVSDNTSTGIVANLLGLDAINKFSESIGMIGTTHRHKVPPLHWPATVMSSTRTVGASTPWRNSRSFAGARLANMSLRLPATVSSFTGQTISPLSIQKPAAPRL